MTSPASGEEAYLLGCLFGRGSIEIGKSRNYVLVFRIPFREYSPVAVDIVKNLQRKQRGLTAKEIRELPTPKAYGLKNAGLLLGKLRRWHPPRKIVKRDMLKRAKSRWKINSAQLASEFLRCQDIYLEREKAGMEFVLQQLKKTTGFLATNPIYEESISEFGIVNHVIKCEITPKTFLDLKNAYGLEEGDIYRHARVPETIFNFPKEALQDFIRGLADTIATIDVWLIPRIQFSVIHDNYKLPIDICRILQEKLSIPVYYIGWAGRYAKRKSRDHLVKVWIVHFDKPNFPRPLFCNKRKQEEFYEHLAIARKKIKQMKKAKGKISWLEPCPKERKKTGYMKICISQGCTQIQNYYGQQIDKWVEESS